MGRPTVMTPEVIQKLEEAFAWGCSDTEACLWADIATKTLYVYQEKNPQFAQRKADLKETPILIARKSVVMGMKRDPKLSMDYLSRKRKDEFSTKSDNSLTIHMPQPILGGSTVKELDVHSDNRDQQVIEAQE